MAKNASREPMKIPALDNTVYNGMLYNCLTKKFIPGLELECGRKYTFKRESIDSEILTEKEFYEKNNNWEVSGSVKFSIKLGIDINGKISYKNKSSKTKDKLFLDCEITTKKEEAIYDHTEENLKKNKEVIEYGLATHVVAAIEYGANAVFEFEEDKSDKEKIYGGDGEVNLGLDNIIKLLPSISGKGDLTVSEISRLKNVRVKFTADFIPEKMPTNFEECLELYKNLHELAGEGRPRTIHLLPLLVFDCDRERKIPMVIKIDQGFLDSAVEVRQVLEKQISEFRSYLGEAVFVRFPALMGEVKAVTDLSSTWLERFHNKGVQIIAKIECGEIGEKALLDHIEMHERSPFNQEKLDNYIEMVESWKLVFEKCHEELYAEEPDLEDGTRSIKVLTNNSKELQDIIDKGRNNNDQGQNVVQVVCFTFEVPKKSTFQADMFAAVRQHVQKREGSGQKVQDFSRDIETFAKFAKENKNAVWIFNLLQSKQTSNHLKHSIEVYEGGRLVSGPGFKLPYPIRGVHAVEVADVSAHISWKNFEESYRKTYEIKISVHHPDQEKHLSRDQETSEEGQTVHLTNVSCDTTSGHQPAQEKYSSLNQETIKEGQTDVHLTNLHSDTTYEVAVRLSGRSMEKIGLHLQRTDLTLFSPVWSQSFIFKTKPAEPELSELGNNRFRVMWKGDKSKVHVCEIEITKGPNTLLKETRKETRNEIGENDNETIFEFSLEGDGIYQVFLTTYGANGSCIDRFRPFPVTIANSNQLPNLRAELKENSPMQRNGTPKVYLLPMEDKIIKLKKGKQIGKFKPYMAERIVLVLGTSSKGRKMWMNMLVSSLLGVNPLDNYYFAVSMDTTKPGEKVVYCGSGPFVYRICQVDGFHVPYTLTMIDTEDLPSEATQSGESLCEHISSVLNKLGPGFIYLDAITVVHDKNSNLVKFENNVTDLYKEKIDEHVEGNVLFTTVDENEEVGGNLTKQKEYLHLTLTRCKDTECRRQRFKLSHACDKVLHSLSQFLNSEDKRRCLLEYMKTGKTVTFTENRLEKKYEKHIPKAKALNCEKCDSTCQTICTDEEVNDIKQCAIFTTLKKKKSKVPVYRCEVCPEECGIEHHRVEEDIIVEKSERLVLPYTSLFVGNETIGKVLCAVLDFLKTNEDDLKRNIQKGQQQYTELNCQKTLKDFFGHLLFHISEDENATEEALHWIKKQMEDPGSLKAWASKSNHSSNACEVCFDKYGEKLDCLAKDEQDNFLVPSYGEDTSEKRAHRLSPMRIWKSSKQELKFENEKVSSIYQAYELKHARLCKNKAAEENIKATDIPRQINSLAQKVKNQNESWNYDTKKSVLLKILQEAVKDEDFKEALRETGSKTIGYLGGSEDFLGTGLDRKHSQNLNPRMWTGQNVYGELLMEIRDNWV